MTFGRSVRPEETAWPRLPLPMQKPPGRAARGGSYSMFFASVKIDMARATIVEARQSGGAYTSHWALAARDCLNATFRRSPPALEQPQGANHRLDFPYAQRAAELSAAGASRDESTQ